MEQSKKGEVTVLVKRSIEKDGLPKKGGFYVIHKRYNDGSEGGSLLLFSEEKNRFMYQEMMTVTHWYEEVPLSSLIESSPLLDMIDLYKALDNIGAEKYGIAMDLIRKFIAEKPTIESRMPTEGEIDRETDRQSVLYRIGFKDAIKYLKTQLTSKP